MSYVKHVIQPGEKILVDGRLSWFIYHRAILYLIAGIILIAIEKAFWPWSQQLVMLGTGALFAILALVSATTAWFNWWTTEIAVTDKRIIFKTGFINRHTEEMNMDKVSSVDVDQTFLGRIFDFGTIRILGTGGAGLRNKGDEHEPRPGIENLDMVASPIKLRNAIDVR
jgi:uncharacterized membrane protein YdbT with pleckstrin-like domain